MPTWFNLSEGGPITLRGRRCGQRPAAFPSRYSSSLLACCVAGACSPAMVRFNDTCLNMPITQRHFAVSRWPHGKTGETMLVRNPFNKKRADFRRSIP